MFATLYVPDFALQCVLRAEPDLRACAVAVVSGGPPARVRQLTPAAAAREVRAGMTSTQALGRCPSLLFRSPGPSLLEPVSACLLQCAESVSPWIEATGEGVVTLEWRGGITAAEATARAMGLVGQLQRRDLAGRIGVAETPDLAWLAAQRAAPVRVVEAARYFLAELPCSALASADAAAAETGDGGEAEILPILRRWGIHTLAALTALPREEVTLRLGEAGAVWWDRAAGRRRRLLRLVRAPEIFAEAMELEHEVETLEPLAFILRRFLAQLTGRLRDAGRVAALLRLGLRFAEGAGHEREFLIPAPTADAAVLLRVLETHLENFRAESPIVGVALSAQAACPEQKQFGLFSSSLRDPNQFFATLARLQALLGEGRVGAPVEANTHRPDVFRLETPRFDDPAPAPTVEEPLPGPPLLRYRPPLPADVQVHDGCPVRVFSAQAFGTVTGCRGPWTGSGDWWGAQAWERVEWDVQVGGAIYRLAQEGGAWFLEGAYD